METSANEAGESVEVLPDHPCDSIRLATLLHRSRNEETAVIEQVDASKNNLTLQFAQYELIDHPLQRASLEQEAKYLKKVDFNLEFTS